MIKEPLERPIKLEEGKRKIFTLIESVPVLSFESRIKKTKPNIDELLSSGVINLNKPMGPTSHQVSSWVKNMLGLDKVGHGGTLDPRVTGVLPLAIGKTAKILYILTYSPKKYVGVMRLHQDVPLTKVKKVCSEFVGPIYQLPPVRSAVKRQLRVRSIYSLEILEHKRRDVLFTVTCEAGTYIRSLVNDIGIVLGMGAHMQELRRTGTGPFAEQDSITLQELKDAWELWREKKDDSVIIKCIKPKEQLLGDLPKIFIQDSAVDALCHGADLAVPGIIQFEDLINRGEPVAVFTRNGEGVALGEVVMQTNDILESGSGVAVRTRRVLMHPGTYKKGWKKKG